MLHWRPSMSIGSTISAFSVGVNVEWTSVSSTSSSNVFRPRSASVYGFSKKYLVNSNVHSTHSEVLMMRLIEKFMKTPTCFDYLAVSLLSFVLQTVELKCDFIAGKNQRITCSPILGADSSFTVAYHRLSLLAWADPWHPDLSSYLRNKQQKDKLEYE